MKPILLLLFAATAACVGALLPLISRARSKRLLLNAVRRASSMSLPVAGATSTSPSL